MKCRWRPGPTCRSGSRRAGWKPGRSGWLSLRQCAAAERDFPGPEMVEHLFTDVWVRRAVPDLSGLTEGWRPDLVVHEEEEYAGVLLAAIRDVPCVTQSWAAPARPEAGRRAAQRLLDPIWRGHLTSTVARRVGELYLDACPPPFQAARDLADLARETTVVSVRPGTWDGPASDPPGFLADLPHPAAYVTLGTVPGFSTPERLTQLVDTLQDEFASLVVTTGPNPDTVLEGHPAHVHVSGYLSQSQVRVEGRLARLPRRCRRHRRRPRPRSAPPGGRGRRTEPTDHRSIGATARARSGHVASRTGPRPPRRGGATRDGPLLPYRRSRATRPAPLPAWREGRPRQARATARDGPNARLKLLATLSGHRPTIAGVGASAGEQSCQWSSVRGPMRSGRS